MNIINSVKTYSTAFGAAVSRAVSFSTSKVASIAQSALKLVSDTVRRNPKLTIGVVAIAAVGVGVAFFARKYFNAASASDAPADAGAAK